MKSSLKLEEKLKEFALKGFIIPHKENNVYLKLAYKGTGNPITVKWNVKIYTSGSVVCSDEKVLEDFLNDTFKPIDKSKKVLQIDDSGVGFPLCGVMVGVTDGVTIKTDVVDVKYFQGSLYEKKEYLKDYTQKGLKLVQDFGIDPKGYTIEICSGFINKDIKEALRLMGYDVHIQDIKGLLQDNLEKLFKEHVKKELGIDLAYDPKESKNIAKDYYRALDWGKKNAPDKLKTGWKALC